MIGLLCFVVAVLASPIKAKIRLEAENAALRHQLVVLRRQLKGRARLTNDDRWFFVQLYRWFPSILPALMIIRPETLVRWHRAGFRRYWRWQDGLLIDQNGVDHAAHLDELLPIPAVASEARDLAGANRTNLTEANLRYHPLKASALYPAGG